MRVVSHPESEMTYDQGINKVILFKDQTIGLHTVYTVGRSIVKDWLGTCREVYDW